MSTLLSPLSALAAVADTATQRASELSAAAQSRVRAELEQFEKEAEKKEAWKVEAEKAKEKIAAAAEDDAPAPRRLVFSIEDEPDAPPAVPVVRQKWEPRLEALMTIVEREADAAAQALANGLELVVLPRMPPEELLLQLKQLQSEVKAASATASAAAPSEAPMTNGAAAATAAAATAAAAAAAAAAASSAAAAGDGGGTASSTEGMVAALQGQVESLSTQLAKAELQLRSKAETHRREIEALEARLAATEEETLDRMRIVAESVEAEGQLKRRATEAEEELASVRRKAAERMKALITSNKGLEEEISRLKEVDELNQSKMRSLEASLHVVDGERSKEAALAVKEAAKQLEGHTYARALMLRYLELEDQHEALFPALASAFKLTQQEVQRIQLAQQKYASEKSIWGRTLWAGSRIVEAAKEVSQAAAEVRAAKPAGTGGAQPPSPLGGSR